MHKYYLVTPLVNAPSFDPGVTFISHGCKHLITMADPDAYFFPISNTIHSQPDWDLLQEQADCIVLAGIPLYDPSSIRVYWNYEIWDHINRARQSGIPVADLWGYSSYPLPTPHVQTMATDILTTERTKRLLKIQKHFNLIITRDPTALLVASSMRDDVGLLPCCSYWAHEYFNVTPQPREYNSITLRHRKGQEWILEPLYALSQTLSQEKPTFLTCHTRHEYWWAKRHLPRAENILCIYDPKSLLQFYSRCSRVISIRLHATLPALSLGCKVINLSIDSRSQALDSFGIPSIPYTDLKGAEIPLKFHSLINQPTLKPDHFITRFQEEIVSKL